MKIAIVLPTRGLVFTEVENAIEEMRQKYIIEVFRSYMWGIPTAQNQLTLQALAGMPDYILFIEEDTVPPEGALVRLIEEVADIAFIDYSVGGWSCSAKHKDGTILWCGFGCTLVDRKVFEKLEKPYFRTDKTLRLNDWIWTNRPNKYGGQDIWFCSKAREAGFIIKQAPGECKHLQIDALGKKGVNEGRHIISQKPEIKKQQILEKPLTTNAYLVNNDLIGN